MAKKKWFTAYHGMIFSMVILLVGLSIGFGYKIVKPKSTFPSELLISHGDPKQIGMTESILKEDHGTVIAVHYPKMGYSPLDRLIYEVVHREIVHFQSEFVEYEPSRKEMRASMYTDFESYLTNDRFIGIVFQFEINSPTLAHPQKFQKVLNYDLEKNQVVDFSDIFRPQFTRTLSSFTRNYLEGNGRYQDETNSTDYLVRTAADLANYSKLLLGNEGVHVYFDQAEVLSSSKGLISFVIPYKEFEYQLIAPVIPSVLPKDPTTQPKPPKPRVIDPSRPMIALTFDDGPTKYTSQILDVLSKYESAATFFVLGSRVNGYPEVMKQIVESGSEVGNHSHSHRVLTKLMRQEVMDEIRLTNQAIDQLVGVVPTLIRAPFGMFNQDVLNLFPEYVFVQWSVDTEDWRHKSGKKTLEEIKQEAHDGAIILMHDLVGSTSETIEEIVVYLLNEGYQLVTVSEMMAIRSPSNQVIRELLP